ncbi:hypothetical protein GCM10029992_19460 [Glycomyces albus]
MLIRPLVGELGDLVGGRVHGLDDGDERVVGVGEDLASGLGVVAVDAGDQRLVDLFASLGEGPERADDAVGDLVAGGDAAEDVHEDALDLRVGQDDLEAVGHDRGRGAASDVEEVGRLDAAVLLAGVGDHVEGRHDQARAVADDADLAVELDVVEVLLLGALLQRVDRGGVGERLGVLGVPEVGVLVEGDLRVQRQDLALGSADQRVDLHQGGVLGDEGVPEPHEDLDELVAQLGGEPGLVGDLAGDLGRDAHTGVDGLLDDLVGGGLGDLLDLDPALGRGDAQERAVRPVEQVGEVVLGVDVGRDGQHDLLDRVAFDVHPEDVGGVGLHLVDRVGEFDAAGLAAASHFHLRFDDHPVTEALGELHGLLRGGGDAAVQYRHTVPGEQCAALVFVQIHCRVRSTS